jgi:hypothetical protein
MNVRFKDLSLTLKAGIIGGLIYLALVALCFTVGVITELIAY